tara:strand:- start:371 stop:595 length:225 start_codon:yes stop_codon:yes gene_type:complete
MDKELLVKKLRIYAILFRAKEIEEERKQRIIKSLKEPVLPKKIDFEIREPMLLNEDIKGGQENRRERRKRERKR